MNQRWIIWFLFSFNLETPTCGSSRMFYLSTKDKISVMSSLAGPTYHDGEDQGHYVDRVRRTEAGEKSQTEIAAERRWRFLIFCWSVVKKCTPIQGTFHVWIQGCQSHCSCLKWRRAVKKEKQNPNKNKKNLRKDTFRWRCPTFKKRI